MSYYAIDFERPYVSPYLRRRCRSLAEVEAAHRDGAAAWKETQEGKPGPGDGLTIDVSVNGLAMPLYRIAGQPLTSPAGIESGPLHHHAQPKGGE